jgi:tRNA threonylcarbamoyladenosine biosynthesis protein TsaE
MRTLIIDSEAEMLRLGILWGECAAPGDFLFLTGDLGAGKTTLTKGIGLGLEVNEVITSPTFQLKKSYQGRYLLNHLDLYRLKTDSELDILEPGDLAEGVTVVEWGDLLLKRLHDDHLEVTIEFTPEDPKRKIMINPHGRSYFRFVEVLDHAHTWN